MKQWNFKMKKLWLETLKTFIKLLRKKLLVLEIVDK